MLLHHSRPLPTKKWVLDRRSPQPTSKTSRKPLISCNGGSFSHPNKFCRPYTCVMIVPTGVGACIGGFAGDALPVARALAATVDRLISHPNVLNAAMLYWPIPNALYVEGYALDRFAQGSWALQPVHQNKVGLVLDAGIEEELRVRHLQVADATRSSLGLPIVEYIVTDTPLQVEKWINPKSGQSTGQIKHPDSLLRAVNSLVRRCHVNAVAVVARFPDDDVNELEDYRQGKGIDVLAGVEAVISHLVVKEFQIPCAHAPALLPLPLDPSLCPRSAAEEIGYTFLPCVLAGLSMAPQYLVRNSKSLEHGCIWASDVDSVIVPIDACGGEGTLAFARSTRFKECFFSLKARMDFQTVTKKDQTFQQPIFQFVFFKFYCSIQNSHGKSKEKNYNFHFRFNEMFYREKSPMFFAFYVITPKIWDLLLQIIGFIHHMRE